MSDKEQIETLYREMYEAMVRKDTATLNRVHADDFVLTHMTGMHQSKQVYIKSIANGKRSRGQASDCFQKRSKTHDRCQHLLAAAQAAVEE